MKPEDIHLQLAYSTTYPGFNFQVVIYMTFEKKSDIVRKLGVANGKC